MIINDKRALAYIAVVHDIRPIAGADNIELIHVIGWQCIARKGEFQEGDKAVYFEIDSKVPASDTRFAFMSSKNYNVKTYKLSKFGVIGQGLAMPVSMFPEAAELEVGTDVTDLLGITYIVEEDNLRKSPDRIMEILKSRKPKLFKNRFIKWLMKRRWGSRIIKKLWCNKTEKATAFPSKYCDRTDEERIQSVSSLLLDKKPYTVTEKIDGTSSTYVLVRHKHWWGTKYEFIVSSRNVRQLKPTQKCWHDDNVYWEMAIKYDLENEMRKMLNDLPEAKYIVLQGETYGEGLQGNKYKMKDRDIRFFNLITDKGKWETLTAAKFVYEYGLKWVPIINTQFILPDTVEELLEMATGPSAINNCVLREGYVLRRFVSSGNVISFKAVSPEFLIKNKE